MRLAPIALGLAAALALSACSGGEESAPSPSSSSPAASGSASASPSVADKTARASLIFGQGNVFRQDISKAPVDPTSKAQIARLMAQIRPNYNGQVAFNTHHFNSSMYVATPQTPKVRVGFDNCQHKPGVPDGLYDGPKYFVDVPIPPEAQPSTGTDAALTVWAPDSDQMWELWVAKKKRGKNGTPSWTACWGGRLDDVSKDSRGVFPAPYGVSASGLATVGSMVTIEEAKARKIEHAMQLHLIYTRSGVQAWPANRDDGRDSDPNAIPEGSRLRLPASVDVDRLQLTPLGKAIARAAQTYGFIVTDTAGAVAVVAESPKALASKGTPDPWPAILGGVEDYDILKGFPWDRLEVVEHGYGAPAGEQKLTKSW